MIKTSIHFESSISSIWEDYVYRNLNNKSKAKSKYRMGGSSPRYKVTYSFNPRHLSIAQIYDAIPNHQYNKKLLKNPIVKNQCTEFDFLLGWHFEMMKAMSQYRIELKNHMKSPNIRKRNFIKYKKEFDIAFTHYQDVKIETFEWLVADDYLTTFRVAKKSWHKTYDEMVLEIKMLENEYINKYYQEIVPLDNTQEWNRVLSFFKWDSDLYLDRATRNAQLLNIYKDNFDSKIESCQFKLESGSYSIESIENMAHKNRARKSWTNENHQSFEKEIGAFEEGTNNIAKKRNKQSIQCLLKDVELVILKACYGNILLAKNTLQKQLIKLKRKERKVDQKALKKKLKEKNLTIRASSDGKRVRIQIFKIKPKLKRTKEEKQEKIHLEYANQEKRKAQIISAIAREKEKIRSKKALKVTKDMKVKRSIKFTDHIVRGD